MFDAITKLFGAKGEQNDEDPLLDPKLCAAALLVHLSAIDGEVSESERKIIEHALVEHYELAPAEVADLVALATQKDHEAVDFYSFTSTLNQLELDEKLHIIKMMWQVVYADQENHELEDNMVWRVAELIGVSSRERTTLRSQIRKEMEAE